MWSRKLRAWFGSSAVCERGGGGPRSRHRARLYLERLEDRLTPSVPVVSISVSPSSISPGGTATFTVTRTVSPGNPALPVSLGVDMSSSVAPGYGLTGSGLVFGGPFVTALLTFPSGILSAAIKFTPDPSGEAEAAHTFQLDLDPGTGYSLGKVNTAVVAIKPEGLVVTNTNASGDGSLAQAVANANSFSSASIITFAAAAGQPFASPQPQKITVAATLDLKKTVIISGPSAGVVVAGGGPSSNFSVFVVEPRIVAAINGVTVTNGHAGSSSHAEFFPGGGIRNAGVLSLVNCTVTGNTEDVNGGGIFNSGVLTLNDVTITGNSAGNYGTRLDGNGGGIFNSGTLNAANCTISGNSAEHGSTNPQDTGTANGGGIYNSGTLTVSVATISANTADNAGGGIANEGGTLTLNDTTVSGNTAGTSPIGFDVAGGVYNNGKFTLNYSTISGNNGGSTNTGGGIRNDGSMTANNSTVFDNSNFGITNTLMLTVSNVTITGNSSGIANGGTLTLNNTIVAGNTAGGGVDVAGPNPFGGNGHNLIGSGATSLAPLGSYGGPTQTVALLPGSPALRQGGAVTTLPARINSSATTITVSNGAAIASTPGGGYLITIGTEQMLVTNVAGNVLTVIRGYNQTSAASHPSGAGVFFPDDQRGFSRPNAASVPFHLADDLGAFQTQGSLTLVVTSAVDPSANSPIGSFTGGSFGALSLREAVNLAEVIPGSSTITFAAAAGQTFATPQTITLGAGLLLPTAMTIDGPAAGVTIQGGGSGSNFSVLTVAAKTTAGLGGLTISNGFSALNGGGIDNQGMLTLFDDTIAGNSAANGGGIFNELGATLTVTNTTISGNFAQSGNGGGIDNQSGTVTLTNVTIWDNSAIGNGGGIDNSFALTATNATIVDNNAKDGGGIDNDSFDQLTLNNTIVAANLAITDSDVDEQAGGGYLGNNANLIGGGFSFMAPLGNYGGPTQTVALLPGSPAIGAGAAVAGVFLATDQRGFSRPAAAPDLGGFQTQDSLIVNSAADPLVNSPGSFTLRQAVNLADVLPGESTITFADSGGQTFATAQTIHLTGSLVLNNTILGVSPPQPRPGTSLVIDGSPAGVTIAGGGAGSDFAVITVTPQTTATLEDLTISQGHSTSSNGGGIDNQGTLTVSCDTISGNSAPAGGGIDNTGALTVSNSTITGNSAQSGNGGGIDNEAGAMLAVSNATVTGNSAALGKGGGIVDLSTSFLLDNTIVAGNKASTNPDISPASAAVANLGFNLIGTGASFLGPLGNNGGPTQTIALLTGSPAIGKGVAVTRIAAGDNVGPNDTTITVTSASAIASSPGHYIIQIDGEEMLVTNVDLADNTLTVERGYFNTAISSHNPRAIVFLATDQRGVLRSATAPSLGAFEPNSNPLATSLAVAPSPATFGQAVELTAAVSGPKGAPAGTVIFVADNTTTLGTGTLSFGVASIDTTALTVGSHTLTAIYQGEGAVYGTSTSNPVTLDVTSANTTVSGMVTPANPAADQPVVFTVTVSAVAPGSGTPTGFVQFQVDNNPTSAVALNGGQASLSLVNGLTAGAHVLTATYLGDGNFNASGPFTLDLANIKDGTTVTGAITPAGPVEGQPFTFTVTVNPGPGGSGTPTGSVQFQVDNGPSSTMPVVGGQASLFLANGLSSGPHTLTATYLGDSNFDASAPFTLNQTILVPFLVTNTSASGPGSLAQAILDSNAHPTFQNPGGAPNVIAFDIPAGDPGHVYYQNDGTAGHLTQASITTTTATDDSTIPNIDPDWTHSWYDINLQAQLTVTTPVIIDGYSQPGASPNTNGPGLGDNAILTIDIDGAGANGDGLVINGADCTIEGLAINGFAGGTLLLSGDNNVVQGDFIGTDISGKMADANAAGVLLNGNMNTIGGTTPDARNVISGNGAEGIGCGAFVGTSGSNNLIEGNFIGTNAAGNVGLSRQYGIIISEVSDNTIGGTTAGARNIISGDSEGISIGSGNSPALNNVVEGNYIGTDVTGTIAVPNQFFGVSASSQTTIGGTAPGAGNVISGNTVDGVDLGSDDLVEGNLIGTAADGVTPLGNQGNGVFAGSQSNDTISGNVIANNKGAGILIGPFSGSGNAFLANSIYANGFLGINFGGGVVPNHPGGSTSGPNDLENYPVITSAASSPAGTIIQGTFNSAPSTNGFLLQFFGNASADPSGFGEGQTFLGSTTVNTDTNGNATFTLTVPAVVAVGQFVTATATDPNNNTSEFSQAVTVANAVHADLAVTASGSAPSVNVGNNLSYTITVTNNGPGAALAVTLTDTLPSSVTLVTAAFGQGSATIANGTVTLFLNSLASGASDTLVLVVTPTTATTITDIAAVAADTPDPDLSNNSASVQTTVDLGAGS